jgi:hypothetical protein
VTTRAVVVAIVFVVLAMTGCSGGGSSPSGATTTTLPMLRADLIPAGVAAVEAARGGPQQYTEINAFAGGVNLFVSTGDGNELAYVYHDGKLDPPPAPQPSSDAPFATAGAALDAGPRLIKEVTTQLEGSIPVALALVQRQQEGLVWDVTVIGTRGGQIDVLYTPQGTMLGVVAAQ